MAQYYMPFDSVAGDRAVTSAMQREIDAGMFGDGVLFGTDDAIKVYADSTGLQVKVKAGSAIVQGEKYINTSEITLDIDDPDTENGRIDLAVLRLDITNRNCALAVVTGTPGISPTTPSLTRTSTIYELGLAKIAVGAGVNTITADDITDKRSDTSLCGRAKLKGLSLEPDQYYQDMYANSIINGDMQIWSNGTNISVSGDTKYAADKWQVSGNVTASKVAYDSNIAPYALRLQRTGGSSTDVDYVQQSLTNEDSKKLIGKRLTFSCGLKCGADITGTIRMAINTPGYGTLKNIAVTPSTSHQTITFTTEMDVPESTTYLYVKIYYYHSTETAGTNEYIDITNCILSATDFYMPFSPKSYNRELLDCSLPSSNKIVGFYRALDAASGPQTISLGFKPMVIRIYADFEGANVASWGVASIDGTMSCMKLIYTGVYWHSDIHVVSIEVGENSTGQYVQEVTFNDDGVTLRWLKSGSPPSGNIYIIIEADKF